MLTKQKILSNQTFYFTYRDDKGNEIGLPAGGEDKPKVALEFKINMTDYVRRKFVRDTHHNMRCAYHTSDPGAALKEFGTRKCETAIVDELNQLVYTSERNFTLFDGGNKIINVTSAVDGVPIIENNTRLLEMIAN